MRRRAAIVDIDGPQGGSLKPQLYPTEVTSRLNVSGEAHGGPWTPREVMIAALIAKFLPMSDAERAGFAAFVAPRLLNWRGLDVGGLRPAGAIG